MQLIDRLKADAASAFNDLRIDLRASRNPNGEHAVMRAQDADDIAASISRLIDARLALFAGMHGKDATHGHS